MQKLVLNSTQIPHYLIREVMPLLSDTEFRVLIVIADQTYGWHKETDRISYSQLVARTGRYKEAIAKAIRSLREKGYILVLDENGKIIKTKEEAKGKSLYYKINITGSEIEPHQFDNRSSEIEHTKDTNTKTITKVIDDTSPKRTLSCPLKNPSNPLKAKYIKGHLECAEYVNSFKFVNKGKQFKFLHQMLRAGLDFPDIDKLISRIEKKPYFQENGYDFATVASEADRRFNARKS